MEETNCTETKLKLNQMFPWHSAVRRTNIADSAQCSCVTAVRYIAAQRHVQTAAQYASPVNHVTGPDQKNRFPNGGVLVRLKHLKITQRN